MHGQKCTLLNIPFSLNDFIFDNKLDAQLRCSQCSPWGGTATF